ncbi:HEAT repeat protein [Dictyocaulus viviparus]|uniref:HEAT repeat protein n=1 Tax=Dictyocaulus viviparus TaxID=29172 RepID=A0A0D8XZ50_DICVI|nr:HEAT repeat protein [Dictyocaulus viviparus]
MQNWKFRSIMCFPTFFILYSAYNKCIFHMLCIYNIHSNIFHFSPIFFAFVILVIEIVAARIHVMAAVLSSFFSRDPKSQFSYEIPQGPGTVFGCFSFAETFKKGEPEELATIFWSSENASLLKLQAQKLRTLRHPDILTYQDSIEVDGTFYLVTEKCKPLLLYLEEMSLNDSQKDFIVSWGLFRVMNALKFLHEANLSHENVRRSVYVTAGGDWKLAGFDRVTNFSTPQTDLNQLAMLLWEIFNGFSDRITKSEAPGKIPRKLHDLYKRIATPAAARTSSAELIRECRLSGGFFKNKFVDTLLFLEEFQLKETSEKQPFFNHLRENLDLFPDDIAKYKILPKIIQTYEYGDAGPNILIPLFKLGRLLEESEYQKKIVPCLVKLFGSSDRTTRVKLLERIDEFAPHLSSQVLNEKIFPNIVTGFVDTSPAVRECTVKAMVALAEKLNFNNLNVELLKFLAKLQGGDEHGGIRTNTTICLGKIANYLDPSKRQIVLLNAFTRGMKDPFTPARMAAVLALSATQQFYSLFEIANRVIPALSPLTYDAEKQVRDQAFKAIKGFMENLEKASENPELIPEIEAQVKAGGRSLLNSDKVPQWASWALKSLSGKFYKGKLSQEVGSTSIPESGQESGSTAIASVSSQSKKLANLPEVDGWGDLEDNVAELDVTSTDDWADALEPSPKADEDDWSSGWESPELAAISSGKAIASQRNDLEKKPIGRLKLKQTTLKDTVNDDIDSLLGITSNSRSTLGTTLSSSSKNSTRVISGWDNVDNDEFNAMLAQSSGARCLSTESKAARHGEVAALKELRHKKLEKKAIPSTDKLKNKGATPLDGFEDW